MGDLDKRSIRLILEQMGETTYVDIVHRVGRTGMASPLLEMVQAGEVIRTIQDDRNITYRLRG